MFELDYIYYCYCYHIRAPNEREDSRTIYIKSRAGYIHRHYLYKSVYPYISVQLVLTIYYQLLERVVIVILPSSPS